MKKAYSTLNIKAVDEDAREITGIASTPGTDRHDDIVAPEGAEFTLPIPLLWQHRHAEPIGQVVKAKITDKGIEVVARIVAPTDDMPPQMAARLQEAWVSLKTGLVRGLSIGFNPIEYSFMDNGGINFLKWDWTELSAVTIPANSEATITSVKSFDKKQRAALGKSAVAVVRVKPAGASACVQKNHNQPKPQEGIMKKTISEQLAGFQAAKEEKAARMMEIMKAAGEEGVTLDTEQTEEFDNLEAEVEALEKHISRLEKMEKTLIKNAVPVTEDLRMGAGFEQRRAPAVVRSVKNDEPGVGFARFAMAMYAGKGNVTAAKGFAESVFSDDVRLQSIMKAAVASGTTTSPTWAGNLVDYQSISGEFIDYLRPRTIVGQFGAGNIPPLRRVPFNVRIPGKAVAGTAQWVGESYRKPATSSGYETMELGFSKIAGFSVITEELERFADPSIQEMVRNDLAEAVIERADIDFIDPDKAVGTGASQSPASITNGLTPIAATGDPDADINALWAVADQGNLPAGSAVYITNTATARVLASRKNPLGNKEYPDLGVTGGFIDGVPVIVSNYVPTGVFVLAFASEIYLADDGVVNIDISREATLFLDSEAATKEPTAAQLVSMFQTNQLAIRAERYIHWKKRRPQAAAYLAGVDWGAGADMGAEGG